MLKKKPISNERFSKALEQIKKGNASVELLIDTFNLTDEQNKQIEKL
jgi:ABC-type enterochelin transport system substrate-binding protein